MLVLGRLQRVWISLLALVLISGCSSTSLVKTYDGPQVDPSRSAVLSVSGGIEILSVNGKEVKKYMLPELDLNYQLLPGENIVTFTHETLWAKPGKKEIGEPNAELIVTKPMMMQFNAKAGEVYHFDFVSPDNKREARNNVATFKATLLDSSDSFVAESTLHVEGNESASGSAIAAAPVAETSSSDSAAVAATTATVAVAGGVAAGQAVGATTSVAAAPVMAPVTPSASQGGALPSIEALKVLWEGASTEEKKEFLKWAFK